MASGTINSDVQDGVIYQVNATYATARNAATGTVNIVSSLTASIAYNDTAYTVQRGFFSFNVADTIPGGNTVTAATLSFSGDGIAVNNTDTSSIAIVQSTQAALILAIGDYSKFNTTELAPRMNLSAWTATDGVYNDFVLNASGRAIVQAAVGGSGFPGKWANFCVQLGKHDLDNLAPTATNSFNCYLADNASSKPQLVVTYVPSGSGLQSKYW